MVVDASVVVSRLVPHDVHHEASRRWLSRHVAEGGLLVDDCATYGHTAWYAPDAKRLVRLESNYAGGPTLEVTAWSVQP